MDSAPATPTEIVGDHGHVNHAGLITDAVRFDLPIKFFRYQPIRTAVVIWCYPDGSAGIALRPWTAPS